MLRANGGANLFIINPAGIIFSEGASLDIDGSFFATTADSIVFSDGIEFSAIDRDIPPLLTIDRPIGLVLGDNTGAILNQSIADDVGLQVLEGNNLTLVGGDIEFNGGIIFAPGANIELGGLSAAGEIGIDADGSLNFPEDIARADVTLTNGTDINVQAEGGGNITVSANNIEISSGELGQSFLSAGIAPDSGSLDAQAGNITLNATGDINVTDSRIRNILEESGQGDSGDINLRGNNLFFTRGGSVAASTSGLGNAGTIVIKASDSVIVDGEDAIGDPDRSGITSTVGNEGVGNAGGINIITGNLLITNKGKIDVQSTEKGTAGSLFIQANSLSLDNSFLLASTPVGEGGSITLDIADSIILRHGSSIFARAFRDADGGNVTINANSIVAFPNQNNDIVANANRGDGGEIDITNSAILGITERNLIPTNTTNDLDASSKFGIAGTVTISEIETNPAEGLEELPTEVIDVANLVAQNLCQQEEGSEFIVSGKGGLASSPSQTRNSNLSQVDLVEPVIENKESMGKGEQPFAPTETNSEIVEAQGWIISDRGTIELVAHSTNAVGSLPQPMYEGVCSRSN